MGWQEDVLDLADRFREAQKRERPVVTPEKRRAAEARTASVALGLCLGTWMVVRQETGSTVELYFWLALGVVLCVVLGSAREWPLPARLIGVVLVAVIAGGLTLTMAALSAFTGSLG